MAQLRVLIVEDDPEQRELLKTLIAAWGHSVEGASTGEEALERVPAVRPHVMITDLHMPGVDGFALMERLRSDGALPPTIVLTAYGSVETAIETVHKYGGFWFLEKPVNPEPLRMLIERAAERALLAADNERLRMELSQRGVLGDLIGQSHAMQNVFALIRRVGPTDTSVMITGESGSGKELVARALHSNSARASGPFLAINCAAIPESLMESEIFGHEKGAFTGSVERRAGALELAEGGTLFLDEICEMPAPMQAKLLRVLEDFRFRRLGGKQEIKADIRLLSATNREPEKAIAQGRLREDLYYRLNVFQIRLPPLRERLEDVPLIAESMLNKLNAKHGTRVTHLAPDAKEALLGYSWEGNVRQLRNVVERAVIVAGEGPIEKRHLLPKAPPRAAAEGSGFSVGMTIDQAERLLIEATLKQTSNNRTRAAALLGISARTLHARLRQYRLEAAEEKKRGVGQAAE